MGLWDLSGKALKETEDWRPVWVLNAEPWTVDDGLDWIPGVVGSCQAVCQKNPHKFSAKSSFVAVELNNLLQFTALRAKGINNIVFSVSLLLGVLFGRCPASCSASQLQASS